MVETINRRVFLRKAGLVTVGAAVEPLSTHPAIAEVESPQTRTTREKVLGKISATVELNQGELLLLWGPQIEAFDSKYNGGVVMGVLALNDIGAPPESNTDGFRYAGVDIEKIRLYTAVNEPSRRRQELERVMASKVNALLFPGGSSRSVTCVAIEVAQLTLTNPVRREWIHTYTLSR